MTSNSQHQQLTGESIRPVTRRLIPLIDWNRHHAWPPTGGLRHLVFHASANGFAKVMRKIGRRILIDEQAFFDWADDQKGGVK